MTTDSVTLPDLVGLGLSRRQADYWTRKGWLRASSPGPWRPRSYAASEAQVAEVMRRLTTAGLTPEAAHGAARNDGWITPDVQVVLHAQAEAAAA